jgi:uncharacterized protein
MFPAATRDLVTPEFRGAPMVRRGRVRPSRAGSLPTRLLALACLLFGPAACGDGPAPEPDAPRGLAGTPDAPATRAAGGDVSDRPERGWAWVILASDTVVAEVADTPEAREQGLMHRTELAPGTGMLFVYDAAEVRSFWMRNTLIPLDIAFLDETQRVIDIQQMEPLTEALTTSAAPAMFALEVPEGWFASRGIEVGLQARIVFGRR